MTYFNLNVKHNSFHKKKINGIFVNNIDFF